MMQREEFHLYGEWKEHAQVQVAALIVHDDYGRLLMQLRDDFEHVQARGTWALFGGQIEADESWDKACRREAEEELGLKFRPHDLEPVMRFQTKPHDFQHFVFRAKTRVKPHQIRLGEGAGFGFLTRNQVMNYEISPSFRDYIRGYMLSFHNACEKGNT